MRLIKILILAVSYFLFLADSMAADKTTLIIGKVAILGKDKNNVLQEVLKNGLNVARKKKVQGF